MTHKTYLAIAAALKPNQAYKGVSFYKDQTPRDFTGFLLLNEIKSIKASLSEEQGQALLKAFNEVNATPTPVKQKTEPAPVAEKTTAAEDTTTATDEAAEVQSPDSKKNSKSKN